MAIDYIPEQNDYTNLTPFKAWLVNQINTWGINNFPFLESDFDKLTNYGMMMKLMKAINDVISNQNLVETDMNNLFDAFTELQTYINSYFDNLDVQEEINEKLDEMVESGELTQLIKDYVDPIYESYEERINANIETQNETISTQNNEINVLNSRVNSIVSLPEGSTTGDAELIDIRVAENGRVYASAGDAVRSQFYYANNKIESLRDTGQVDIFENIVVGKNIPLGSYSVGQVVDLTPESVNNYSYIIYECKYKDKFLLTGTGGVNPRLYAWLDANNKLISKAGESASLNNQTITAPYNTAKIVINVNNALPHSCSQINLPNVDENRSMIDEINSDISELTGFKNLFDDATRGYITPLGNYHYGDVVDITAQEVNSQYVTGVFTCKKGDVFILTSVGGNNPRAYAFLDNNNRLLVMAGEGLTSTSRKLVAPEGTSKIVLNANININSNPSCYYKNAGVIYDNTIAIEENKNYIGNISQGNTNYSMGENELLSVINGINFSRELNNPITDFKKDDDLMVHVSTFCIINNIVYMTYYANRTHETETPSEHIARFVYCNLNDLNNKTYIDLQNVGDTFDGKTVTAIYDTILLRKDDNTLYLMWTAKLNDEYYRLYRTYDIATSTLGDVSVNYFKVGYTTNEFKISGMNGAFTDNNISHKALSGDIGIMQRLTSRTESGTTYYYTGCYVGEFNCIIKSSDLITWQFVAQPDFINNSQWENAVYVKNDKAYYFVRQKTSSAGGFLTYYNLTTKTWATPVFVDDCQSRSDFFEVNNTLYLIHAPLNRYHLSIMTINTECIQQSYEIQTALTGFNFYPFVQSYNNELYISFTQSRKHIYLCKFTLSHISKTTMLEKLANLFYD